MGSFRFRASIVGVTCLLAVLTGVVLALGQGGEGQCCNQYRSDCSGCIPQLDPTTHALKYYVLLPTNPVYLCQSYVNPLSCEQSRQVCYSGALTVFPPNDPCMGAGAAGHGTFSMNSCDYDSCD